MSDNCKARWFLYYYLVCCVTDLHIVPFRVSHNCLNPTDGVSAFIPPYFPRISTSPGPLPPPDSLTLILLCYYPAPSTGCFIFYFLPQYYGAWVADSQIVSVCLLFVCSTGEREVWNIHLCTYQARDNAKAFQQAESILTGMPQAEEGVACPTKIIKPHHFKSPQHPVMYIIRTAREDEQLAGELSLHVFPFKKINHTQKFFNHFTVSTVQVAPYTEFSTSVTAPFLCRWNRLEPESCSDPVLGSILRFPNPSCIARAIVFALQPTWQKTQFLELLFPRLLYGDDTAYLASFGGK